MSGRTPAFAAPQRTLGPREFRLFQRLIEEEAGIHLVDAKRVLVEGRLARRLRELGLDYAAYYELVLADPHERVRMLDCMATNETHFFREPRQFEFLESRLLPEWQARVVELGLPRKLRVWSAGCSTGEEPCSVAMSFLARFPPRSGFEISVLATDLSTRALEKAASFVYPLDKSHEVPAPYLKAFMLRGSGAQAGRMKVGAAVRDVVRYARLNLNGAAFDLRERFDVVLCRNVLIYFDTEAKRRVVSRLLERLDPAGHLFLGHAETLSGLETGAASVGPTVYRHAQGTAATPPS